MLGHIIWPLGKRISSNVEALEPTLLNFYQHGYFGIMLRALNNSSFGKFWQEMVDTDLVGQAKADKNTFL